MEKSLVVLVSGRGSNLQALIDAVEIGEFPGRIVRVVSDNPRAYALRRAEIAGIETTVLDFRALGAPTYDQHLLSLLNELDPDLIVLAGYMRILPHKIVEAFRWRIINVHPSLLPAFPGLHAQKQALDYGVKVSGCTVHFVDEGVDTGPVILQQAVRVKDDDDVQALSERILAWEHRLIVRAAKLVLSGQVRIEGRRVYCMEEDQDR